MGDHPFTAPSLKKGVSKGHPFSMGYFFVKWLLATLSSQARLSSQKSQFTSKTPHRKEPLLDTHFVLTRDFSTIYVKKYTINIYICHISHKKSPVCQN
jgi:hypothetical protein